MESNFNSYICRHLTEEIQSGIKINTLYFFNINLFILIGG